MRPGRRSRRGNRSSQPGFARQEGEQAVEHTVRGFANRQGAQVTTDAKVVLTPTTTQRMAVDRNATLNRSTGIHGLQRALEDAPRKNLGVKAEIVNHEASIGANENPC